MDACPWICGKPPVPHPLTLPREWAQGRPALLPDPSCLPCVRLPDQAKQPSLDLPPAGMDVSYFLWGWNDENLPDIMGLSPSLS